MGLEISKIPDANKSWHFTWICQWPEWFGGCYNWRNFDVIRCDFEFSTYKGKTVEVNLSLLGLCLHIEWTDRLERAVFMAEMDQLKAEAVDALRRAKDSEEQEGTTDAN